MKRLIPWAALLCSALLLAGCPGPGDDDDDDDNNDNGTPSQSQTTTAPAACSAPADFGALVLTNFVGDFQGPDGNGNYLVTVVGSPDAAEPFDLVQFEFYTGFGVFTGGYVTGSFAITGAEASYNDCGACSLVVGDVTSTGFGNFYAASGGTLNVNALPAAPVANDQVAGDLAGATFTERETTAPFPEIAGGCTSAITSVAFDVMITDGN